MTAAIIDHGRLESALPAGPDARVYAGPHHDLTGWVVTWTAGGFAHHWRAAAANTGGEAVDEFRAAFPDWHGEIVVGGGWRRG